MFTLLKHMTFDGLKNAFVSFCHRNNNWKIKSHYTFFFPLLNWETTLWWDTIIWQWNISWESLEACIILLQWVLPTIKTRASHSNISLWVNNVCLVMHFLFRDLQNWILKEVPPVKKCLVFREINKVIIPIFFFR